MGLGLARLCRESRLTPWNQPTLSAVAREWFFIPGLLPHGECGAWGKAPGFGGEKEIKTRQNV